MIDNFISCTLLSIETAEINRPLNIKSIGRPPIHIVRVFKNVKQFLSGAKNYLVKTGEGDFFKLVEEEKAKVTILTFQKEDRLKKSIFSSSKQKANSGLKIWLVSDKVRFWTWRTLEFLLQSWWLESNAVLLLLFF